MDLDIIKIVVKKDIKSLKSKVNETVLNKLF